MFSQFVGGRVMKTEFLAFVKKYLRKIGIIARGVSPSSDAGKLIATVIARKKITLLFDIGANSGQFGKDLRLNNYAGRIISFEPLEDAHLSLIKTAKNDTKWSVYERCAIGGKDGFCEINISENSVSSSTLKINKVHLAAAPASKVIRTEKVPMRRLSSILADINLDGEQAFLKLDVQGGEFTILEDLEDSLQEFSVVLTEVSISALYEGQKTWLDVKAKIEQHNFKLWSIIPGFTDNATGQTLQVDMLFVSNSK